MSSSVAAGEPDHLLREVEDLHRLAHVEHVDLAAAAHRARLHDERRRLRDRHEEARHLGVRDRHRAAALDLAAEDRDHRARRAEHVAEAHRDEARLDLGVQRERLDDPLADRLRLAHHVLRVRRLVGRDEDEALDAELDRDLGERRASRGRCSRPPAAGSPRASPTCLYAAAWKTTCGLVALEDLAHLRAGRRMSASTGIAAGNSRSSTSSRSISNSADSPLSTSTSRAAPSRASWRQSSEPIEPPAPVTSTVLSLT